MLLPDFSLLLLLLLLKILFLIKFGEIFISDCIVGVIVGGGALSKYFLSSESAMKELVICGGFKRVGMLWHCKFDKIYISFLNIS